jgi:hypothetical protein
MKAGDTFIITEKIVSSIRKSIVFEAGEPVIVVATPYRRGVVKVKSLKFKTGPRYVLKTQLK